METREQRQAKIDARVAELRSLADSKEAEAKRLARTTHNDGAFWTQPAYGNAAGRSFSARRDRERSRLLKAGELTSAANDLRARADSMERRGAVMAGDASAQREAKTRDTLFTVGQTVRSIYGDRKVVKVNAKTILIEGALGPIRLEKHLAEVVA